MLTHQETTTLANRSTQTIGLKTNRRKISTPEPMIKAILHGLQMWEQKQQNSTTTQQAPTFKPAGIALTQAYSAQMRLIGWDNFLRGQISSLWG